MCLNCLTFYSVSQRPEHPTAAAGEEPEVEADLAFPGMAQPTRELRQSLPRALKMTERFKAWSEMCWQRHTEDLLAGYNTLGLAWLTKSYQTSRKIPAAQLDWAVCLRAMIWTPFLSLFNNRVLELISPAIVSDFKIEEQLIWIHTIHGKLQLQGQLASVLLPDRKMTPCMHHSTDQPQLQWHKHSDKHMSRELNDTLQQPGSGRCAKFQLPSTSNTSRLTFPLPGDQLYHRSRQSHQLLPKGHIKQWAQPSPTYSRNAHLCYSSCLTRCVLQTSENTKCI